MGKLGEVPNKPPNENMDGLDITTNTAPMEDFKESKEYTALEKTLDQLDSCLDNLEEQNDTLNTKLKELLESTLQIHQEMAEKRQQEQGDQPKDNPTMQQ